jgi:hypothetical protein
MGLASKYLNNTGKPTGVLGKVMVSGMNGGHAALASWGSQFVAASPRARVLDEGYADVRLIHTDEGLFMEPAEAKLMMLSESTLLVGTK